MTNKNNYTEGLEELLTEIEEPSAPVAAYSEDDDAVTQLLESPLSDQEWMVQVSALDRRMMATSQVLDELNAGNLNAGTLVWRGGMDDWAELASVPELNQPAEAAPAMAAGAFGEMPDAGDAPSPPATSEAPVGSLGATGAFNMRNNTTRPVALDSLPDLNPRSTGGNKKVFAVVGVLAVAAAGLIFVNFKTPEGQEQAAAAAPGVAMNEPVPGLAKGDEASEVPTEAQEVAALRPSAMEKDSADDPEADAQEAEQPEADAQEAEQQGAKNELAMKDESQAEAEQETTAPPPEKKKVAAATRKAKPRVRRSAVRSRTRRKVAPRPALVRPASQVTAPKAEDSSGFDRTAAQEKLALAATQAANCRPPGGPTGTGRVQIRYAPTGDVSDVNIQTEEFQNTTTGGCVRMLFRRASVPAFKGSTKTVTTSFTIPE